MFQGGVGRVVFGRGGAAEEAAEAVAEGDEGALEVADFFALKVAAAGGADGFGPGSILQIALLDGVGELGPGILEEDFVDAGGGRSGGR